MEEQDRLEKAKLEEERLNRAFNKKKSGIMNKPLKISTTTQVQSTTTTNNSSPRERSKTLDYKKPVNTNVVIDDIVEEQISYTTVEQDNKKITKKLIKKIKKTITSSFDESLNVEEIDWIEGDLCAAFNKNDQKYHHAKIKKPTGYGSFWVIFQHDLKEQDTIRTALRPLQGIKYQMIDRQKKSSNVETEESEGLSFLKSQNNRKEVSSVNSQQEDKELSRLGFQSQSSLAKSENVITGHLYDQLDESEINSNRERYEQLELERLSKKVVLYDPEEEQRRLQKEEEERIIREKQEIQRKKTEERLRQFEESQKKN